MRLRELKSAIRARIVVEGRCWLWIGASTSGVPVFRGHSVRRMLWSQKRLPRSLVITASCNLRCVRPEHCKAHPPLGRPAGVSGKPTPRDVLVARFWRQVGCGRAEECWKWRGRAKPGRGGYIRIGARCVGRRVEFVHRVAWRLHHGVIPTHHFVCHRCDNPPCCNPAHLFLGTTQDNTADRDQKQRQSRGEVHPKAKLTDELVRSIRRRAASGETGNAIAVELGLERNTIYALLRGKTWKHVEVAI
jgi:hypothetical protein